MRGISPASLTNACLVAGRVTLGAVIKIEISAKKRELQGTGASRRLRNAGKVPGIVYGGTTDPVNIELDHKDLARNLSREAFHASILTMDLDGRKDRKSTR